MGIAQDIKKLQEQVKVLMDLLRNPSKQAGTVLYLVETIQKLESVNYDYAHKWNMAVAYLQNKQLVDEYNEWVTKADEIQNPQMRQVFMMQPIDGKPEKAPDAPALCGKANPFKEDIICFDISNHEGDEHIGVDKDGRMFKWTDKEDLGEVEEDELPGPEHEAVPQAPADANLIEENPLPTLGNGTDDPSELEEPEEEEEPPQQ